MINQIADNNRLLYMHQNGGGGGCGVLRRRRRRCLSLQSLHSDTITKDFLSLPQFQMKKNYY